MQSDATKELDGFARSGKVPSRFGVRYYAGSDANKNIERAKECSSKYS
jgi:hypothetical protein